MHHTLYKSATIARVFAVLILVLLCFPRSALGETRLTSQSEGITVLSKEGSPYILEDYVAFNQKVVVQPGVVIMTASSTRTPWENYSRGPYIEARGGFDMLGTAEEPIRLIGLAPTLIRRPVSSRIEHVHFENSPLFLQTSSDGPFTTSQGAYLGTTTIVNSKLSGSLIAPGLEINSGAVVIEGSEIVGNPTGILSDVTAYKTNIAVRDSVILGNRNYDVQNLIQTSIDATSNWWGSEAGPGEKVSGNVRVEPWKTKDPREKPCCSSVLFLPGLQASRLYRNDQDLLGGGTTTRQAWEPFTNQDVRTLFLSSTGESIDPTIHTGDVIEDAYGIKPIYKNFVASMKGLVAEKKINEWLPFAYDWRKGVIDVVTGLTPYGSTSKILIEEVERLARASKTGKVSIVAHSNGGLIAKVLGKELEKMGKGGLIDKVLLVAVPALGTPQAIAGMLHGVDQGILGGLVLKNSVARTLGINMPSAYGLLPSRGYLEQSSYPVITNGEIDITSYESLQNFLTSGREQAQETDLRTPALLSSTLAQNADLLHSATDSFSFSTTTEVLSVAGWGVPTTRTIEYSSSTVKVLKSSVGDGTVQSLSAIGTPGNRFYFNQGQYNFDLKKNTSHADILENELVRTFVVEAVATSSLKNIQAPKYFSEEKPAGSYPWMKWLTISVHSPVDIDVYNSEGGHIGLASLAPNSDVMLLENTLGGHYEAIGDEKYITVPADDTYAVKLRGTGVGNFTFQVQKFVGEDMTETANVLYADLPVTPLLVASTTVTGLSTSPQLLLDIDGNGTTDIQATSSELMNPFIHLDAIKTLVLSLGLDKNEEKQMLHRIEKIRTLYVGDKRELLIKKIQATTQKIEGEHWNIKTLTSSQKELLGATFETLLSNLETTN